MAYSKAVGLDQIADWRMRLAIAHNPYQQDAQDRKLLFRLLDQSERAILDPDRMTEPTRPKGISLKQLERVMGSVKENLVSREEWSRQQTAREEQKEKAQAAMARLRERRSPKTMASGENGN